MTTQTETTQRASPVLRTVSCRKYGAWFASAILACLGPTSATAASLACVQRAIEWKNASSNNNVNFALVALHESGEGAYAYGGLATSYCNRVNKSPYPFYLPPTGPVSCLISGAVNAQLLHPYNSVNGLLGLSVDVIPSDDFAQVRLRQAHATYDFYPACVGNLLVGSDQWGNRWTVSFELRTDFPPR